MRDAWGRVFGLDANDPRFEDQVVQCLQAVRAEADLAQSALADLGVPMELLASGLGRFRDTASAMRLATAWESWKANIAGPEHRIALQWAAWALRDWDEGEAKQEEFKQLLEQLQTIEESLDSSDISGYVRDFSRRQIDSIRQALNLYPITGVRGIEKALRDVAGDVATSAQALRVEVESASPSGKGVLAKMNQIITKTADICDKVSKVRKAGQDIVDVAAQIAPLAALLLPRG